MAGMLAWARDPIYLAALAALVAIAVFAGVFAQAGSVQVHLGDGGAKPVASVTALAPAPIGDADVGRMLDLGQLRAALELHRGESGAYPSTQGDFATVCQVAFDAGCLLLSIDKDLPVTDGTNAYWWQSDGRTYTFFAVVESETLRGQCPAETPPALAAKTLFCASGGNR